MLLLPKQHLCKDLWQKLGDLGVRKKFRSKRGGKKRASPYGLPVVDNYIGVLQSNQVTTAPPTTLDATARHYIPSLLIGNLRYIAPKVKGARSRYFMYFCLILLIMSSKGQIGRARVFHLQNHGHITTENDFPAV